MITKSIRDLSVSVTSGITPLRSNPDFWANGTVPWLKTEQLGTRYIFETNEKITDAALRDTSIKLNPPDTLSMAMYGEGKTRGTVSVLKSAMTTNQACCNIVLDNNLADVDYVYYFLKTQYQQLRTISSGVRKNLNSNDVKNFEIRIPEDVNAQKRIAAVLSAFDSKIELNNRINAELEAMAKILYGYWFVQFDFPDKNGHPYKSSGGKMVYNEILKREIPEGWEAASVQEITTLIRRGVSPRYVEKGGYCVLNQKCVRDQKISFGPSRRHGGKVDSESERLLRIGDVLVNSTGVGTLGRVALVKRLKESMTLVDSHVTVVRNNPNVINTDYFGYSFLKVQTEIERAAEGSTGQVELSKSYLEDLRFVVPTDEIQSKFSVCVVPLLGKAANIEVENEQLINLRDWLLPMLMNGQVTIGDQAAPAQ